jgi:hypothetical protein
MIVEYRPAREGKRVRGAEANRHGIVRHYIQDLARLRTERFLHGLHAAQPGRSLVFRKNPELGRSARLELHRH